MKRTLYILFHGRFPSEKAASLFAAKEAESFADQGERVVLLVSRRKGASTDGFAQYYGVKPNFEVKYLPVLDLFGTVFDKVAFFVSYISFAFSCLRFFMSANPIHRLEKQDIVMSNDIGILFVCSLISKKSFYEMHDFPESKRWLFAVFLRKIRYILVHNKWKYEQLFKIAQVPRERVLCLPNAVEIEHFNTGISTAEARPSLGLPQQPFVVIYTGHLFSWKGVTTLADAAALLPNDVLIVFVGGTEKDVAAFRAKYAHFANIRILGHRNHSEMPLFQKAADVLVLPNTAKENISKYYTSPMKFFEYMAAKKPIIASDIPSIREIISPQMATFFEADNAADLAAKIKEAKMLYNEKVLMAERAFAEVQKFSWSARAKTMLAFIEQGKQIEQ